MKKEKTSEKETSYDKIPYNSEYTKTHYKQFKANIKNETYEHLKSILSNLELTNSLFVRMSINSLKKGMIKMKTCDEIRDYLKGKEIEIEYEERDDFAAGNYSAQSEEDTIVLDDGYLSYTVNAEITKCYIDITKRTDPNDVDDKFIDDSFFDGYFTYDTLYKLLDLIQ